MTNNIEKRSIIVPIFISPDAPRLRAGWRILLQALLLVILIATAGLVSGWLNTLLPESAGPLGLFSGWFWARLAINTSVFLAITGSVWLGGRLLDRRPFVDFGLHTGRQWWRDLVFGLFLGSVLMTAIFAVELAAGWVTITTTFQHNAFAFPAGIVLMLVNYLYVGLQEELLSRGYHLTNLAEGLNFHSLGPRGAVLIAYFLSASVFGLMHLANPNTSLVSTINLMLAGLFLGLGYVLTGELAIPIGLHITWNFFQGNVFGFPISGGSSGISFIAIQQAGPETWTGGAFGPEAGLIGLLAMVAGALLIAAYVRSTRGRLEVQPEIAIYSPAIPAGAELTDLENRAS